jgi:hypothetical protein
MSQCKCQKCAYRSPAGSGVDISAIKWVGRLDDKWDVVSAFVHESPRPDCDPAYKFRAVLPTGFSRWFPTRVDAEEAVWVSIFGVLSKSEARTEGLSYSVGPP